MAGIWAASVPDSMTEDTKAANAGGDQPLSFDSSVCTKSRPKKPCLVFSTRPYMWVPHSLQAWRWMVADESTISSLPSLAVTLRLSRGVTATTEKTAPLGFQHLLQPQA